MKLTLEQRQKILDLRLDLICALVERSKKLADYDAAIIFIKEFARTYSALAELLLPLNERIQKIEADTSRCNFIMLLKLKKEMKDMKEMLKEANDLFYDPNTTMKLLQANGIKETRVATFNFKINHHTHETNRNGFFSATEEHSEIYTITFKDRTTLVLNSLTNETELAKGRTIFDDKLRELDNVPRLT